MICSNCGETVRDGAKFCENCGTPVPQVKKCISCGAELMLTVKFCPECGARQDGGASAASGGISMGSKNVIAGDVIGHQESMHVAGNATIIKNEDQLHQVKTCHICGSNVLITDGFVCKDCGEFTCNRCHDNDFNVCSSCAQKRRNHAVTQYNEALKNVLADGRIDFDERRQLDGLRVQLSC